MESKYGHILIALDGSEVSEDALKKAIQIAKRNQATLTLINVVDTKYYSVIEPYGSNVYKQSEASANEMLAKYASTAKKAGLEQVKYMVKLGSPKAVITKEIIPEERIDLIVVGATGTGAVERMLMGSVSENIVRYAKCDVLVVR